MSTFENNKYVGDSIDLDTVAGTGNFLPAGRYTARLSAATGRSAESKGEGKLPDVHAQFEILEGQFKSLEVNIYYTMGIWPAKKSGGRPFAPGIAEIRQTAKAVKSPLPTGYLFPTKNGSGDEVKAAKILAQALRGKTLDIANINEAVVDKETKQPKLNEKGEPVFTTRAKVLGLAHTAEHDEEEEETL